MPGETADLVPIAMTDLCRGELSMSLSPVCVCGHTADLHEHYRKGADCAECGPVACAKYRKNRAFGRSPKAAPTVQTPTTPSSSPVIQNG
jgi:hypothetical protein